MCCILQVIWVSTVSFKHWSSVQVTKSSCGSTTIHWRVTAETTTSSPNCAYSIAVTGLTGSNVICHHNFLVKRYVTLCAIQQNESRKNYVRFCKLTWEFTSSMNGNKNNNVMLLFILILIHAARHSCRNFNWRLNALCSVKSWSWQRIPL